MGIENVEVDTIHGVPGYKRKGADKKVQWAPPSALRRIAKAVYGTADPAELRNVAADEDIFDDDDRAFLELAAGDDDFDDDYGED